MVASRGCMRPIEGLLPGKSWLWPVKVGTLQDLIEDCRLRSNGCAMLMHDWDPTQPESLRRYLGLFHRIRKSQRLHQAKQLHCMKVLPEGLIAWALSHAASVPYVLYAHGEEIQMRLTSRKLAWLIPILYRGARAIIANSCHTKQLLLDIGVCSDRIQVIHPGVDAAAFCPDEAAGLAIRARHNLERFLCFAHRGPPSTT